MTVVTTQHILTLISFNNRKYILTFTLDLELFYYYY